MQGIYEIRNKVNGKRYIGRSKDIFKRWCEHEKMLRKGTHHSHRFQNDFDAFNKDVSVFEFKVIECCEEKYLKTLETKYINIYDSTNESCGYNMLDGDGVLSCEEIDRLNLELERAGVIYLKMTSPKFGKMECSTVSKEEYIEFIEINKHLIEAKDYKEIQHVNGCFIDEIFSIEAYEGQLNVAKVVNERKKKEGLL